MYISATQKSIQEVSCPEDSILAEAEDCEQELQSRIDRWLRETRLWHKAEAEKRSPSAEDDRPAKRVRRDTTNVTIEMEETVVPDSGLKRPRPLTPGQSDRTVNDAGWEGDLTPRSNMELRPQQQVIGPSGLQRMDRRQPPRSRKQFQNTSISSRSTASSMSRSISPKKRLRDALVHPHLMKVLHWSNIEGEGPSTDGAMAKLVEEIREIEDGGDLFPIQLHNISCKRSKNWRLRERIIHHGDGPVSQAFSDEDLWARMMEIQHETTECLKQGCSEAAWNDEVHSRLLKLAFSERWRDAGVWYRNTTAAKIDDDKFTQSTDARQVDYCITIGNSAAEREEVEKYLRRVGRYSINHTSASDLRFTPIAVSIETKRGRIDEDEGMDQLGTWVAAQFPLLRCLVRESAVLPPMILIFVQGQEWRMMIAISTGVPGEQGRIFKDILMGESGTLLGIWKIVQCLRCIARYLVTSYEPWFKKEVMEMTGL